MRKGIRAGTVTLTGLMRIERRGRVYWYLRRRGRPLVRLPDLPHDDPAFLAAYAAARADDPPPRSAPAPGSIAGLIAAALASDTYLARSPVYRATLRRHFEAIRRTAGHAPARGLRDYIIRADVTAATNPTDRLKAWRFLTAFGLAAGLLPTDPARAVAAPRRAASDGHPPWAPDQLDAYRARWRPGTSARLAFELLHWTGARIGDAVRLGPGMIDRDGVLVFRQGKTGDIAYVPWSCPLPAYAAGMEADRRHLMATLRPGHMTFLATAHGGPRSEKALGNLIRESARACGIERSAHGLRKTRAIALAEAGATVHQITAWTGHRTLKEAERYTRAAERRRAVMGTEQKPNDANQPAPACKTGDNG